MLPRAGVLLILLSGLPWPAVDAVETDLLRLSNNPFTRPEVLKPKPPPPPAPRPVVVVPPDEVELDLSATMVSDTRPMVVVDGELLAIGEKIQGLKLISVMEGKAVFARGAKKYFFEINSQDPK